MEVFLLLIGGYWRAGGLERCTSHEQLLCSKSFLKVLDSNMTSILFILLSY